MAYNQRVKKSSNVQTLSKEDILDAIDKFSGDKNLLFSGGAETNAKFSDDHEESLQEEWNQLFQDGFMTKIKAAALNGNLGTQHFRSICWRVFWKCLSENPAHWVNEVNEQRKIYTSIRNKYVINPYEQEKELDLEKHHPLSQSEDSIWHKYFQDNELRSLILIDLDRLSPELEFFQNDNIRSMILQILFCYAREKPEVSYKQGMHEIISVIVYVIMKNATAIKDSKEDLSDIKIIMDYQFVEHDSYILFTKIMESIQSWFTNVPQPQGLKQALDQRIFKNPDNEVVTAISEKLNRIQGSMLNKYDSALCQHLQKIDISPQLYGIRWVRLLFGREFSLNKLLTLWDALFAEGAILDLVDFVFLAMLINLRGVLLQNDFNKCLFYLMKYPANTDSKYILKQALSLKNHSRIKRSNDQATTKHLQQHKVHPVRNRLGKTKEQLFSQSINSGNQIEKTEELRNKKYFVENAEPLNLSDKKYFDKNIDPLPLFNENRVTDASTRLASQISQFRTKVNSLQNPLKNIVTSKQTKEIAEDNENLQEQLCDLQNEFNNLQNLCKYCGDKMESYINLLQHRLLKEEIFNDEIAILSIAGLKQVREIFKGSADLNFLDHEADFKDIDSHIALASNNHKQFAGGNDAASRNTDETDLLLDKHSRNGLYQGQSNNKTTNCIWPTVPGNLSV
ncbi:TBC1 domain family member 5 isoform X2 [Hydra vulgaris]|uniref:TBC1 domain family member 5 isoform X2 n=1 Tax=Hydra vulgaris TaxID=6087 RepID=UPI001F5EE2D6|nr:TBC1 domain family member 5 isoform X2 [Hydra vulgaris]